MNENKKFDINNLSSGQKFSLGLAVLQLIQLIMWFLKIFYAKVSFMGVSDKTKMNFGDLAETCKDSDAEVLWGIGFFNVLAIILIILSLLISLFAAYSDTLIGNGIVQAVSGGWATFTLIYAWISLNTGYFKKIPGYSAGLNFGGWITLIISIVILAIGVKTYKEKK